jgi:uncharacterized protein Smg (DUF494 family)
MKDNLLEKLMQLFDQRLAKRTKEVQNSTMNHDQAQNNSDWSELSTLEDNTYFVRDAQPKSKRVLCLQERVKFTQKSAKFLEQLLHMNLIGEKTFELIMNQLLFSDSEFISLREAKWVVHHTLADSLDEHQLAFLDVILYHHEDNLTQH